MKATLLITLSLFATLSASAEITLRSADGREATFTGILKTTSSGIYVSRADSPAPIKIRWSQLDREHYESTAPAAPSGIYAQTAAIDHPHAAIYRILHHVHNVSRPKFELYFSRRDDHINRLWNDNYDRYMSLRRETSIRFERMLHDLFPGEEFFVSHYGYYERYWEDSPLTPMHALDLMTDPNNNSAAMIRQYLSSSGFLRNLARDLEPPTENLTAAELSQLQRVINAIRTLDSTGPTDTGAQRTIRRFIDRHKLPN